MTTIAAYDLHVEQLTGIIRRLTQALAQAGIEFRLVGGMAVFLHVYGRDPLAARVTRDVDVSVRRKDLGAIAEAVRPFGFTHRHAAGVDKLIDAHQPEGRSAVHMVFVEEEVRPEYQAPVPGFTPPVCTQEGILLAPVSDLVRMKLTSFRLKDQVQLKDLDSVGLITTEIEQELPDLLRQRLLQVRAVE